MPEAKTREKAQKDKREGKAASTQAGEYVHEEIEHIREGKHGARSARQAIAIGLSKARRDGVKVPAKKGAAKKTGTSRKTSTKKPSPTRSRATTKALKKEGRSAASKKALSAQTRAAAKKRTATSRSAAAKKAVKTKGATGRSQAAKKAARTRRRAA
jgi:hypothetical protein